MEFFHKVTRFPFMHTRKVWYALSTLLIIASVSLVVLRTGSALFWPTLEARLSDEHSADLGRAVGAHHGIPVDHRNVLWICRA